MSRGARWAFAHCLPPSPEVVRFLSWVLHRVFITLPLRESSVSEERGRTDPPRPRSGRSAVPGADGPPGRVPIDTSGAG